MRTMIKWWKERGAFVPFVGLCLILPGIQGAICTALGREMSLAYGKIIFFYSVVSFLLVLFVSLPERHLWKASLLLLAIVGLFVWKNRWDLLEQAEVLADCIDRKYQEYMNQNLFPLEWCKWGTLRNNRVLITFCILLGLYIAWASLKLHSKLLMSMPIVLLYCGALLLGVTPGQLPTLLLIIGMALEMQWITERQRLRNPLKLRKKTEWSSSGRRICMVVLILAAGVTVSWHLTSRISGRVFRNVNRIQVRQHKMEQELQIVAETRGQQLREILGIDSGGYLSNVAPKYLNKPVFTVSVSRKPESSIYLRGFVGDIYQGGKWKASENIKGEDSKGKKGIWKGEYNQSQYTTFDTETDNMEIQYTRLGKRDKYLYTPYGIDSGINEMSRQERELCQGEEDDALSLYQNTAENLKLEMSDYYGISFEVIDNIQYLLWSNASYSLDLDPLPRNRDYAEYFLFYSQKGYCEHFATAGTLLLRNMNHAARYVSGYRISPDQFTYNEEDDTYTAEVLDSDAHAWSEVWVDRNYWMPQEMTPGDSESAWAVANRENFVDGTDSSVSTEYALEQQTPEPSETEKPEKTEAPSLNPESEIPQDDLTEEGDFGLGSGSQTYWSIGKWWRSLSRRQQILLIVSAVVVCVLIFICLYYRGRKRKKLQRMAQMREHNRSVYVGMRLGIFLERLRHSGIAVKITMPEKQWMQVLSEKLQEQTSLEEMEKVAELIRRAAYSREMVTETEVDWFDGYCGRIEGSLTGKLPFSILRTKIAGAVRKRG